MKIKKLYLLLFIFGLSICSLSYGQKNSELPYIDISGEITRHVIIAEGAEDVSQGHSSTLLLADGKTIYAAWSIGQSGSGEPMAVSRDGGLNWERIDNRMPSGYGRNMNFPSLHRMMDMESGKIRLWIFGGEPGMSRVTSDDGGETWKEASPLGFDCGKAFASIIRLSDGNYMGFFHRDEDGTFKVYRSKTTDGGMTWSDPLMIGEKEGAEMCAPFVFRSPSQKELCCIVGNNAQEGRSLMMFSQDEGKTWSEPVFTSFGLTGEMHKGLYVNDGRLVIVFQDKVPSSPTRDHLMAWVGSYDDIKENRPGEYRIKLLHNYGDNDCGYPGIELLPDGTIAVTAYLKYRDNNAQHSVVSTRFKIREADKMLANYYVSHSKVTNVEPYFNRQTLFTVNEGDRHVRGAIIRVASDGTVLAFGGGRLRKSKDKGKTWSPEEKIEGTERIENMIVDEMTGDILVFAGMSKKEPCLFRSKDNGETWVKEIVSVKPNAMGHGGASNSPILVGAMSCGITLKYGEHKGRLLQPGRVQPPNGDNGQEYWMYNYNTSMFSDDRGKTWQVSDGIMTGTGEGTLAQLSDGRIYYNSRSHMSVDHMRREAWSHDGGKMYVDWKVSDDLYEIGEPFYYKYGSKPSYGICAGLVRIPDGITDAKDVLLYSSPDWKGGWRYQMSVWASFNGADTWPVKRLIDQGHGAYSSLAAGKDGTIYLLYEGGDKKLYDEINVAVFNLKWLLEGETY